MPTQLQSIQKNVTYWKQGEDLQNFGDYLSEFFLEEVFIGQPIAAAKIHILGSAIDDGIIWPNVQQPANPKNNYSGQVVFWGCGLRSPTSLSETFRDQSEFLAVRGPLTKSALRLGADVPIGDPALLLPAAYQPKVLPGFIEKTICVPHFNDTRSDEELLQISGCDLLIRPNISSNIDSIKHFVDQLYSSKFILSAALHGVIVAAAYGKPFGYWDNGFVDLPFKWLDFSESIQIPCEHHKSIENAEAFYETAIQPWIKIPKLWPLLLNAPFSVRPAVLLRTLELDVIRHGRQCLLAYESSALAKKVEETRKREERIMMANNAPILAEMSELKNQGASLSHQNTELHFEIVQLKNQSASLSCKNTGLSSEVDALKDLSTSLTQKNTELGSKVDTLNNLNTSLTQQNIQLGSKVDTLNDLSASLTQQNTELCYDIDELTHQHKVLQIEINRLLVVQQGYEASISWKLTRPLRFLAKQSPLLRKFGQVLWRRVGRIKRSIKYSISSSTPS